MMCASFSSVYFLEPVGEMKQPIASLTPISASKRRLGPQSPMSDPASSQPSQPKKTARKMPVCSEKSYLYPQYAGLSKTRANEIRKNRAEVMRLQLQAVAAKQRISANFCDGNNVADSPVSSVSSGSPCGEPGSPLKVAVLMNNWIRVGSTISTPPDNTTKFSKTSYFDLEKGDELQRKECWKVEQAAVAELIISKDMR